MDRVCCIQGLQNVLYIYYRIQINKIRNNNPEILNGGCGGVGGGGGCDFGSGWGVCQKSISVPKETYFVSNVFLIKHFQN